MSSNDVHCDRFSEIAQSPRADSVLWDRVAPTATEPSGKVGDNWHHFCGFCDVLVFIGIV
jgi:hypothetical protein